MKISDFRIHDTDKLDRILVKLCELIVKEHKKPTNFGMVAACVLDPHDEIVIAINYPAESGKRIHAERAAIDKYNKQFGNVPAGSIIVTTLSPCSEAMDEREGDSCTDLIDEVGVHKVYCGYIDPTQSNSENYIHKTFHVKETRNEKIRELCKRFADTFLEDTDEQLTEDIKPVNEREMIEKFTRWSSKVLKLETIPEVELSFDTEEAQEGHHTGRHVDGENKVWVYAKNRNLVDILRTVFHELVQVRQGELDMIKPNSSYPGSPIERQADEMAGKYIKIFGAKHPEIFQ